MTLWSVHGDGRRVDDGEVVQPDERLSWPLTIGLGVQHVAAMIGATVLVPALTGFPTATTLLFCGIGTLLFLAITRNRVPAALGSSFAFVAPLAAAREEGPAAQLGAVLVAGAVLVVVGIAVKALGVRLVESVMPPVVAGAVVLLVVLGLAPQSAASFSREPVIGTLTVVVAAVCAVGARGLAARLPVLLGVLAGWIAAAVSGSIADDRARDLVQAAWLGLPQLHGPQLRPSVVALVVPVVIVLVAETVGHMKAIAEVTGRPVDGAVGDALIANGAATTLAGLGGGSGTTTYAENIGVMAVNRVFSTAAYAVAGVLIVLLSCSPKATALIATVPDGVVGGATLVLFGVVALTGVRIWQHADVDLADPVNAIVAGVALLAGVGGITITVGGATLGGIAWGSLAVVLGYPLLRRVRAIRRTSAGPSVDEAGVELHEARARVEHGLGVVRGHDPADADDGQVPAGFPVHERDHLAGPPGQRPAAQPAGLLGRGSPSRRRRRARAWCSWRSGRPRCAGRSTSSTSAIAASVRSGAIFTSSGLTGPPCSAASASASLVSSPTSVVERRPVLQAAQAGRVGGADVHREVVAVRVEGAQRVPVVLDGPPDRRDLGLADADAHRHRRGPAARSRSASSVRAVVVEAHPVDRSPGCAAAGTAAAGRCPAARTGSRCRPRRSRSPARATPGSPRRSCPCPRRAPPGSGTGCRTRCAVRPRRSSGAARPARAAPWRCGAAPPASARGPPRDRRRRGRTGRAAPGAGRPRAHRVIRRCVMMEGMARSFETFESVAAELYALPREEFIAARTERVEQAKADGNGELAKKVGALNKPSTAAWLANQLARHDPDQVRLLGKVGAALRDAHGKLAGEQLRKLSQQRQAVVRGLVAAAKDLSDKPVPISVVRELESIFTAALSRAAVARELAEGRLTGAKQFGDGSGWPLIADAEAVPEPAPRKGRDELERKRTAAKARRDLAEANAAVDQGPGGRGRGGARVRARRIRPRRRPASGWRS